MPALTNQLIKVLVAQPDTNPYQKNLYKPLEKLGVQYEIKSLKIPDYFKKEYRSYHLYHLHWLHRFYQSGYRIYSLYKAILFINFLKKAKENRIKIILTIHNLLPHDIKFKTIEGFVQRKIKQMADAIIFHDINAKNEYTNLFGDCRQKSFIIGHGVYKESLVPLPEKFESRTYFGIKNRGICILYLGKASKRKGYDLAIKTAREIDSPDIHFIFAGMGVSKDDFKNIKNCTVIDHYIPSYELAVIFSATDYVILPYRKCTTSGLANLSIGYGKPFLCSEVPYLKDLCSQGFGIIYDIDNPMDFKEKILKASESIDAKKFSKNRKIYLNKHSWEITAQKTYDAYVKVINNN